MEEKAPTTVDVENIENIDSTLKDDFSVEADKEQFAEGGRGWLVVLGCVCISFATFGMINSYGAFQTFYETELFPDTASSKLSIIGACQVSINYFLAPFNVPLIYALGAPTVMSLGGALVVISFFGLSTTHPGELWKCYFFQAVMFSVGSSLLFPPLIFSPIEWFKKKRAQALGMSMCGGPLGGMIWPIIFKNMINKYGFGWTCRAIGFVYIPLAAGAVILIPQRIPERYLHKEETISNARYNKDKLRRLPQTSYAMVQTWLPQLKDLKYDLLLLACSLGFLGSFPAIFYMDYFATVISPGTSITTYLLVIFNGLGAPGRIIPGLLSDKFGRLNTLATSLAISGVSILAMWIPCIQHRLITPYAIFVAIFGCTNGPLFALFPAAFTQIFGSQGAEARLGFFLWTLTFSPIIGSFIAGSFIPKSSSSHDEILQGFIHLAVYAGVMIVACSVLVMVVRMMVTKRLFVFV